MDDKKFSVNDINPEKDTIEKDSKYDYSTIFEYNTSDEKSNESKNMSREYLGAIYNDKEFAESINKNILYSRKQYQKDYDDIIVNAKNEIKEQIKGMIFAVFISLLGYILSLVFKELADASATYVVDSFARLMHIILLPFVLFIPPFVFVGNLKRIKTVKKYKENALRLLYEKKKEHMINGTYDAQVTSFENR